MATSRGTRKSRGGAKIRRIRSASELLNIEVTLVPAPDGLSVVKAEERPSLANIHRFHANPATLHAATAALDRAGLRVTIVGRTAISAKGTARLFRSLFGTELSLFRQRIRPHRDLVQEFYYPPPGASWTLPDELAGLVDDAYIQWPHINFETSVPPPVGYFHLAVPGDVSHLLNADKVHRQGTTGKGVTVAMVDTGFYMDHPYFRERGYNVSVILAPGATRAGEDGNGHGTAECANIFAVAPDVAFVGVKLDNEEDPNAGASLAEGFKTAVAQHPDIITVSQGYDLVVPHDPARTPLAQLPNSLKPLEAEVKAAVHAGIVVIFSAGNGHVSFPGMMPEVISAGGAYVDAAGHRQASDYASAFDSRLYPGRHVPDVTGLVGLMATDGAYIMLPLAPGCEIDRETSSKVGPDGRPQFPDGTAPADGWAVISGTSAAAPQLAGVCALLRQKNPGVNPLDVANVLKRTARDVRRGHANPASNVGHALAAGPGQDGATGYGLVDAFAAWKQV